MNSRAKFGLFLAFCVSVGVHGVAYASLSAEHRQPPRPSEVSRMNFELPPLPTAAPEPEPPSQVPEHTATRPDVVARAPSATRVARTAAAATPKAVPAAPVLDLSGVTLTNDFGTGFAMPIGDGSALHGPIGLGASRVQAVPTPSAAASLPKPPALVDASDLSEHPRPPVLTNLLRANYPEEARQRGLRGSASLRARIDADGVIRAAHLLSASSAGFGSACRRTVLGSHWSVPRDKNGGAVATEIVYTCHFEVDQ
ncbi:MAG: TonB family protein [Pseudomonadota bacterium]